MVTTSEDLEGKYNKAFRKVADRNYGDWRGKVRNAKLYGETSTSVGILTDKQRDVVLKEGFRVRLLGTNYGKNAVTEIMAYLDDDGAEGVLTFDDKVEYRTHYRLAPPYACYRFEGNVYEFDLDGENWDRGFKMSVNYYTTVISWDSEDSEDSEDADMS